MKAKSCLFEGTELIWKEKFNYDWEIMINAKKGRKTWKKTEKQWKTNHKKTNKILLDQKNVKNWSSDFFIICQKKLHSFRSSTSPAFWVVLPPNPLILCLVLCCFRFHLTVQCMSAGKTNLLELLTFWARGELFRDVSC